jgi:hypothetical protein
VLSPPVHTHINSVPALFFILTLPPLLIHSPSLLISFFFFSSISPLSVVPFARESTPPSLSSPSPFSPPTVCPVPPLFARPSRSGVQVHPSPWHRPHRHDN